MGGFVYFVVDISDGAVSSVPIVRDAGLRLARRADTWGRPLYLTIDCLELFVLIGKQSH